MKFLSMRFLTGLVLPILLITSLVGLSACTSANRSTGENQVRQEPAAGDAATEGDTMADDGMTDDVTGGTMTDHNITGDAAGDAAMQQEEVEPGTNTGMDATR